MALNGSETLLVQGQDLTGQPAATTFQTTTGAIAALAAATVEPAIVNTAISTAGAGTLTAAGIVGGLITRTGPVAAYTDTTATALQIVAALAAYVAGESFILRIKNTVPFAQTVAAGVGVTLTGNAIVPPNSYGEFLVTITSATAVAILGLDNNRLTATPLEIVTALSTVGAGTITAAGIAGGVTTRSGSQSATPFTDTTDTATAIIAAVPNVNIGASFEYTYKNNTDADATLTGGTGVTVSALTVVPPNGWVRYLVTYTAAATITMAGIAFGGFGADATDATKQVAFKASGATAGATATLVSVATADRAIQLPNVSDTLAVLGANTFTGDQAFGTYAELSVGNALTAVGTNRATALQLAKQINNVTTAGSGTGVILPVGVIGMRISIFNAGANAIQVYGSGSETIDTVAGSTGVPLTNTKRADFFFVAANTWISAQLGVVSA